MSLVDDKISAGLHSVLHHAKENQLKYKYRTGKALHVIFRYLFLVGLSFVMLFPIIFMLSGAFKAASDTYDMSVIWIPKNFSTEAFKIAWDALDFTSALAKTLLILIPSVFLQVLTCVLSAYGFARFRFPLKKILFTIMLFSIIVPTSSIIIPLYTGFQEFNVLGISGLFGFKPNLLDTTMPFYVMAAVGFGIRSGLYIFILRQFFRAIPKELEEASMIDGAGTFQTFMRVMLPNAVTAIVTVAVLSVVWYWNDYYISSMLMNSDFPLSVQLTMLNSRLLTLKSGTAEMSSVSMYLLKDSIVECGCLLVSFPLIAIFVFFQRYFTESIEKTGIVG